MIARGTIGSLFAGVGGLELGLEWAGWGPVLWQVEMNAYARGVLSRHWPDAERLEDVRDVGAANLAPVDIICGGFPCQDVSSAGKGAGLSGARSGLWFEFLRVVRELQPRAVVVENVASGARRWVDACVAGLEREGYEVLPVPLSAADCGAPHLRRRIFLVAVAHADGLGARAEPEVVRPREPEPGCRAAADAEREQLRQQQRGRQAGSEAPRAGDDGAPRPAAHSDRERRRAGSMGDRGREPAPQATRPGAALRGGGPVVADSDRERRERQREPEQAGQQGAPWGKPDRCPDPWGEPGWAGRRAPEPVVRGVDARLPRGARRRALTALGNSVVPQCAQVVGEVLRMLTEPAGVTP